VFKTLWTGLPAKQGRVSVHDFEIGLFKQTLKYIPKFKTVNVLSRVCKISLTMLGFISEKINETFSK